jgi:hypothetical protein
MFHKNAIMLLFWNKNKETKAVASGQTLANDLQTDQMQKNCWSFSYGESQDMGRKWTGFIF